MKLYRILFILLLVTVNPLWATVLPVRLLSERHRAEWNWTEYRLSVKNISSNSIRNPEIRYFAENVWIQDCRSMPNSVLCATTSNGIEAKDTLLRVDVDYSSMLNPVEKSIVSVGKITVVKLKFNGMFKPGKTLNVNFRLHKKDWSAWNPERDWSFQKKVGVSEPHYFFAVYDENRNILWGSDPLTNKENADVELWNDRGGNFVINRFNGDVNEIQRAGRFWILKDVPMNSKETNLLENVGVKRIMAAAKGEKTVILMKSDNDVRKKLLDSLIYGFYNSFNVDDSTKLNVEVKPDDWIEKRILCDSTGLCYEEISTLTSISMRTSCWDDVSMQDCKRVVDECGGMNSIIDNYVVLSNNARGTIQCLESNRNVRNLDVVRQQPVDNDIGRRTINLENLQLNEWNIDFTGFNENVTTPWLSGKKYTGENVVVGVYDTGIYYDHDTFNEWNANGQKQPRRAYLNENETWSQGDSHDYSHATHVAGIIGGNGNGSPNHQYRGVAPKVKFYASSPGEDRLENQRGHVVNHSHPGDYKIEYEKRIFYNWKENTIDTRPKTYVVSSGNRANGSYDDNSSSNYPCWYGKGFHSISHDTKNGIVVGNYASLMKIPNTTSSYGPTWDGRIKPDIMAPGSGFMGSFDALNPFVAYVDYIRISRNGGVILDLNFGENPLMLNESFIREKLNHCTLEYVEDPKASNGFALKIKHQDPEAREVYVNWKYQAFSAVPFDVEKGDDIEIRIRLDKDIRSVYPVMAGSFFLADGDDFYQTPNTRKRIDFHWKPDGNNDGYREINFTWPESNISSKFLRFGLIYDYGIISSVPCDITLGGSCYDEASGTSMAAPYVSGIAALMNQAYMTAKGDKEFKKSLRNSTSKVILIHTADDMVDIVGFARSEMYDVTAASGQKLPVVYGKGPDFVTGWGSVNAEKALEMFDKYILNKEEFERFREFEIADEEKKWTVNVDDYRNRLRVSLAWDDAPGNIKIEGRENPTEKLQNDLDLYLISPSGEYYYPWRLKPLSTEHINSDGIIQDNCTDGLENISEAEARKPAERCDSGTELDYDCFDRLNNVEVVDVDFPERGTWVVVVRTHILREGNGEENKNAQVASIASDLILEDNYGNIGCDIAHPYRQQSHLTCVYEFGNNLANYVTFSNETFVGLGDTIYLYDANDNVIGSYTGNQLAGLRLKIDSDKLKVVLDSDNDDNVGFGFKVGRIELIPYTMFFDI